MKNILILSSSPRRGGNSDTLCDVFMRGAVDAGNAVEKIFLRDKTINYCTGCKSKTKSSILLWQPPKMISQRWSVPLIRFKGFWIVSKMQQ